MTGAHLHLLLNHIPILGSLFGIIVIIVGNISDIISIKRLGLATFIVAALFAIPVYLTGEPAEEAIEPFNIKESVIEAHEEAGEKAFWGIIAVGALAVITLLLEVIKGVHIKGMYYLVVVLGLVVGGYLGYVGNLGGKIRHTEIRDNTPQEGNSELLDHNHEDEEEE